MYKSTYCAAVLLATSMLMSAPALAQSSGRNAQQDLQQQIPQCTKSLGTIAISEPENRWWNRYKLSSPEKFIKIVVARSGCFNLVDRGRGLDGRNLERDLADSGELQAGSNVGAGQVKTADYYLVPDLINGNQNSGGRGVGGAVGGLLGRSVGGLFGKVKVNKKEANVTLSLVNTRTTEVSALSEGYYRKSDLSIRGGGRGWTRGFAGAFSGSGYENTKIGQVIVLAYIEAYSDLVTRLGGLPANAGAAAPQTESDPTFAPGGVTANSYSRIQNGMPLGDVINIIGSGGDRQSSAGGIETYKWSKDGYSIIGVFQNGRLIGKSNGI